MASWPSCRPFSRAAAALALRRDGALAQNRGMWVSQMIRITTPLHIRDRMDHIGKGDAITQIH